MEGKSEYQKWTKTGLIKRLHELEAELARRPNSEAPDAKTSTAPVAVVSGDNQVADPKTKDRKLDPSKYSTRLVAFKLAYLGKNYGGFEFQASSNLETIEGRLWKALVKSCLIYPENPDEVNFDDWEYSKCGRTDRGVSAFGQVIAIRVRSNRPPPKKPQADAAPTREVAELPQGNDDGDFLAQGLAGEDSISEEPEPEKPFDDFTDEIQYCKVLNRLLPPDIRILAWCPTTPEGFSARHNCRERRYRYFFTLPAFSPLPQALENPKAVGKVKDGWLDIDAMRQAAKKFEGLHDFRNFCKIDPGKLIARFDRRIYESDIVEVKDVETALPYLSNPEFAPFGGQESSGTTVQQHPKVYYFHVRGSAFLWHQIRCMVAVLFMVGQGLEDPSIIDKLLDIEAQPRRPEYVLAEDAPLVLWDCLFPTSEETDSKDALDWVYVGEENPFHQYGNYGLVDHMWGVWRERKIDELLAGQLLGVVAAQADVGRRLDGKAPKFTLPSQKAFEGGNRERLVGKYQPIMKKKLLPAPEQVYEKEAKRKGYANVAEMRAAFAKRKAGAIEAEEADA